MQYQVPQFIEIEDKIFGPLTIKQFVYLAGGGGLCLLFLTLLPLFAAIPACLPVVAFSLALAFYKVNDRPFIIALEHAIAYQFSSKLYLWKPRKIASPKTIVPAATVAASVLVPKLSQSKLKDLAWSLNIKDTQRAETFENSSSTFAI